MSEHLCEPLSTEDMVVQAATETSPPKWHLAHTTWFFETFLLARFDEGHQPFDDAFNYLFNSYYNACGERQPRAERGLLTRPPVEHVMRYRRHVDERVLDLLDRLRPDPTTEVAEIMAIGLNHEQQHQELLLTDIKFTLSRNPLRPAYDPEIAARAPAPDPRPARWIRFDEGVRSIGHAGDGFAYDNEGPAHRVFLEPFEIADRPATNAEFAEFIADGGYTRPELWLDEGWATVRRLGWKAPLYWSGEGAERTEYTLAGVTPLDPDAPVTHVSLYEADAFARWRTARLPTEQEWEAACAGAAIEGNFVESGLLHPGPASDAEGLRQAYGDVWEWTRSAHEPYPGYNPPPGALGEYNGKFMCNQFVLRGGSCATPISHIRPTYRNFFHADARWQFSGVRLARSI